MAEHPRIGQSAGRVLPSAARRMSMTNDEFFAREILGHGAYVCLRWSGGAHRSAEAADIAGLAEALGLQNEFHPSGPPPRESIAFLRRRSATPGDIPDDGVLHADAVVHVASARSEPIARFCDAAVGLLG